MIAIVSSLSARRAWIEIARIVFVLPVNGVALRKESVDRNYPGMNTISYTTVALRKESVDRNGFGAKLVHSFLCRSPQGERG